MPQPKKPDPLEMPDHCHVDGCERAHYRWLEARLPNTEGLLELGNRRLCVAHWWTAYRSVDNCPLDGCNKLTERDVAEIRWCFQQGHSMRVVADVYGVGKSTIYRRLQKDYVNPSKPPDSIRDQLTRFQPDLT